MGTDQSKQIQITVALPVLAVALICVVFESIESMILADEADRVPKEIVASPRLPK